MLHATHVAHAGASTDTGLLPREGSPSPPPPTRATLKAWWNQFKFMQRAKGAGPPGQKELAPGYGYGYGYPGVKDDTPHPVFGAPLLESLKYASVQISTANTNGELYVWGDIPVVVAKCGLYLKENATEVEGTFRVSGSNKRMRDLQALFETPPKYGKNLDWKKENYTPHDVASVFRRYLTQMPEPVIPYNLYAKFREALTKKLSTDEVIKAYKQLIRSMPRQNQYLLLYVLDLLSVFARKADKNLMTATNLAVIFRPGLISHPQHELTPKEHNLSQEVLEFLIEHQDWFMLDVPPPPPPPSRTAYQGTTQGSALPSIPDEEGPRSGSPHLTVVSMVSPSELGWRLVEKGESRSSVELGSSSPSVPTRRMSRSGRRRSSSAASSGEAAAVASSSHVRLASAEASGSTSVGPAAPLAGAVTVTRSRTLPSRAERSRKDKGLVREGTTSDAHHRDREREQRHREREATTGSGGTSSGRNVLKKQKRASMQNQRSGPVGSTAPLNTAPKLGPVPTSATSAPPVTSETRLAGQAGGGTS